MKRTGHIGCITKLLIQELFDATKDEGTARHAVAEITHAAIDGETYTRRCSKQHRPVQALELSTVVRSRLGRWMLD